ncbi:MAG: hypothetical protein RLP15_07925 [Cryomorphaceae bacterium]
MKHLHFHIALIASLGLGMMPAVSLAQTPSTSVQAIDAFYLASARANFDPKAFFTPDAHCQVVNYTADGKSKIISLTQDEFSAQVDTLVKMFDVEQQPVVVLSRYYGHLATAYMSVYTRLIDKKSGDTLRLRSIQAVQMIQQTDWKIASLVIQNEVSTFPFSEELWPQELSAELALGIGESNAEDTTETMSLYDPSKVYNIDELQVAPEYPGDPSLYTSLLSAFNVTTDGDAQGAPFTVVIEEDGFARLGYVGDLSGAQIERATSFVKSMLIWYPGVKSDASVKTKLVFYLL